MRQTREIPFAFTATSINAAVDDLQNSIKNKNGVVKEVKMGNDGSGNPIAIIVVEEDI